MKTFGWVIVALLVASLSWEHFKALYLGRNIYFVAPGTKTMEISINRADIPDGVVAGMAIMKPGAWEALCWARTIGGPAFDKNGNPLSTSRLTCSVNVGFPWLVEAAAIHSRTLMDYKFRIIQ